MTYQITSEKVLNIHRSPPLASGKQCLAAMASQPHSRNCGLCCHHSSVVTTQVVSIILNAISVYKLEDKQVERKVMRSGMIIEFNKHETLKNE